MALLLSVPEVLAKLRGWEQRGDTGLTRLGDPALFTDETYSVCRGPKGKTNFKGWKVSSARWMDFRYSEIDYITIYQ